MEIEFFGLKFTVSPGDREVIPPYKIMVRTPEGTLLPREFQQPGIVLNGFGPAESPYAAWSFVLDDSIEGSRGRGVGEPHPLGSEGVG